jgi:hypothetical protein
LADVCTGAGNDQVINSAEGVLYAEISALADGGSFRTLSISNGNSTSNVVGLLYRTAVNEIWMQVRGSGVETNINLYDVNQNENNKIALLYTADLIKIFVNGILKGSTTMISIPIGLNNLKFTRADGNEPFYGNIKDLQVFTTALTDAELIALTT